MEIPSQICSKCRVEYPLYMFGKKSYFKNGINCWCKKCVSISNKEYKLAHKEELRYYKLFGPGSFNMKEYLKQYRKSDRGKAAKARENHKRRINNNESKNTLTLAQWNKILDQQGNRCATCKKPFNKKREATRDHIIPLSAGGGLTFENVQALCRSCNCKKHTTLDYNKILTWIEG